MREREYPRIATLTGPNCDNFNAYIFPGESIGELKSRLGALYSVSPSQIIFFYKGEVLAESQSLEQLIPETEKSPLKVAIKGPYCRPVDSILRSLGNYEGAKYLLDMSKYSQLAVPSRGRQMLGLEESEWTASDAPAAAVSPDTDGRGRQLYRHERYERSHSPAAFPAHMLEGRHSFSEPSPENVQVPIVPAQPPHNASPGPSTSSGPVFGSTTINSMPTPTPTYPERVIATPHRRLPVVTGQPFDLGETPHFPVTRSNTTSFEFDYTPASKNRDFRAEEPTLTAPAPAPAPSQPPATTPAVAEPPVAATAVEPAPELAQPTNKKLRLELQPGVTLEINQGHMEYFSLVDDKLLISDEVRTILLNAGLKMGPQSRTEIYGQALNRITADFTELKRLFDELGLASVLKFSTLCVAAAFVIKMKYPDNNYDLIPVTLIIIAFSFVAMKAYWEVDVQQVILGYLPKGFKAGTAEEISKTINSEHFIAGQSNNDILASLKQPVGQFDIYTLFLVSFHPEIYAKWKERYTSQEGVCLEAIRLARVQYEADVAKAEQTMHLKEREELEARAAVQNQLEHQDAMVADAVAQNLPADADVAAIEVARYIDQLNNDND